MKNLSIKWRVTLWFAGFMAVIMAVVLIVMAVTSSNMSRTYVEDALIRAVVESGQEIEMEDGELELDDDLEEFEGVTIFVYDLDGTLLYGKPPSQILNMSFANDILREFDISETPYLIYDKRTYIEDYGELWVRGISSLASTAALSSNILNLALIIFPILLIIAVGGGYLITKQALKPLEDITTTISGISGGRDLSKRIDFQGTKDEIYDLALIFDKMFEKLEQSFATERRFTSDASHELRTPASVIMSQCEFALTQAKTDEEKQEALEAIKRQAERMTQLISRLLTFARLDGSNKKLELEYVDISELTLFVSEEMEEEAQNKQITLIKEIEQGIKLYCDQTLIGLVWINLLSNAIKYGKEGGKIELSLKKRGKLYLWYSCR
ncbi:HAMP domain-containing protein [Selenomonadales bacterium OttesenSCG-928-I06]|nr:HAMP domain-containing protein [Selenomonadales bacterium OttesenSCG-928-I06]